MILLVALSMATLCAVTAAPVGADDGSEYQVTCGPNPFPQPTAAEDCMPDNSNGSNIWHSTSLNPAVDCEVDPSHVVKVYNQEQVQSYSDSTCPVRQFTLSITVKVFWTTCGSHDGTDCPLNWNSLPNNPAQDGPCNCKFVSALAKMNARVGVTRNYWAHTVARRSGVDPFSHWEGPFAIYIP